MPDQITAIIHIRRGTDAERRTIKLDSGELSYSTDIKRVFIGDGTTYGGSVVGNKNFIGTSPDFNALQNDLYFDRSTYQLYILSSDSGADVLSSYGKITPVTDNTTLTANNGVFSIHPSYLNDVKSNYLNLTGGVMTGYITLHNNPVSANHPATKSFVDTSVSAVSLNFNNYLNLTGGSVIGKLTLLSSFEIINRGATIGGDLVLNGNAYLNGDVDLKGNLLKDFKQSIKNVTLSSALSSYTLSAEDNGSILILSANTLSCNVILPEGFDNGFNVRVIQNSNSTVCFLPEESTPVTISQIDNLFTIKKKYGVCDVLVIDTDNFLINGDLA